MLKALKKLKALDRILYSCYWRSCKRQSPNENMPTGMVELLCEEIKNSF